MKLAGLFLLLSSILAAQPAVSTITDHLYNSITGTPFNGSVTVTGPNVTGTGNIPVLGISRTFDIVNGLMTFQVVPNQSSTPASTYLLTFSNGDVKTCNVPASVPALTLATANCVDGTQPAVPGVVALSQLASGGATTGQGLCFNGLQWVPGACNGNAITINGAVVPHFGLVGTNAQGQIVSGIPVVPIEATITPLSQHNSFGTYFTLTDGTGDNVANKCAAWAADPTFGVPTGILSVGNCLIDSFGFMRVTSQLLPIEGTGSVQANIVRYYPRNHIVSTLAICNSTNEAKQDYVIDALSPTYLGTLTGGGSVKTPVICNGTNWISF